MSLKLPELSLDDRIEVYTVSHSFIGTVGETDSPDVLVLHTHNGVLHLDVWNIVGLKFVKPVAK